MIRRGLNNERLERKFYNEEHHNFYSSPDIIRMIKSRRYNRLPLRVALMPLAGNLL
jgi:hypothetical protein